MNINDLSLINIFVGPNGSGKTNFINALRDCIGWGRFNSKGTCFHEYDSYKGMGGPTEIIIQLEMPSSIERDVRLFRNGQDEIIDHSLKERIYPIGLPHKFSEFNAIHKEEINKGIQDRNKGIRDQSTTTYAKIRLAWQKIREDAKRIEIEIQNNYPKEPLIIPNPKDYADRFFYDVVDNYGVPLLEGSDGIANFLLMIVKIRVREPGSVILIEEPEVSMHPRLQKQFLVYLKYLAEKYKYQFLISTHSPYLLNFAVSDESKEIAVFRVSKDEGGTQIKPVKNKRSENWEILTDLGHSPADILQASCIIWVEGPSDRIYINHWLKAYDSDLEEGLHYSIMFYGGSLRSHLSFANEDDVEELIALRRINQNTVIIMDSDKKNKDDEINETKCRLCNEFDNDTAPGFAWITAGREVENYVSPKVMEEAVKSVYPRAQNLSTGRYDYCYRFRKENDEIQKVNKVKIARQVIQSDAELSVWDLKENISKLSKFIRQSNDL